MSNVTNIIQTLIQLAFNRSDSFDTKIFENVKWKDVMNIAAAQGIFAIAFDGIKLLPMAYRPDKKLLIQWVGQVCYQEKMYEHNWRVAQTLSELWKKENINTYIIKGRSIAQYYPNPAHRYSCDVDVFIAEGWNHACQLLELQGVKLVYEVYKEVEFTMDKVYVECHRCITPYRGNKVLHKVEEYLRSLLDEYSQRPFAGTDLLCPPLMFVIMLYIEHALGDLLHGHLSLKHIVDWIVLRRQTFDLRALRLRCKKFGFDRFLMLIDTLADVIEGKIKVEKLPPSYKDIYKSLFIMPSVSPKTESWFRRRVHLFCEIIKNRKMYQHFGYCSMESFLLNSVWSHFFSKKVELL